jgi:uncharacterized protein
MYAKSAGPVVVLWIASSAAWAASFQCDKARTHVEELVCATESVSVLDSRLGRAYALVIHDTNANQRPGVIAEQRAWIETVRDRCTDVQCLTTAYMSRLQVLTAIKTAKTSAVYVMDEKEMSGQTSDFENSLHRVGISGSLSCTLMVRLVDDQFTGKEQSYGATCHIDSRPILLCDDTMVGKLTVSFSSPSDRAPAVADFTANNCPPGG